MIRLLSRLRLSKLREERGQAIILLALSMMFFMALLVVVADNAFVWMERRDLQNTADAAALAGVQELPGNPGAAITTAETYADRNHPRELDSIDVEILENDHKIRVTVQKDAAALFGGALSFGNPRVPATAAAAIVFEPLPYSLMAMNPNACGSMDIHGQGDVNITGGGGTYTRSSCEEALTVRGQANLDASVNDVVGDAHVTPNASMSPEATDQIYLEDPYGDLVQPVPTSLSCIDQEDVYNDEEPVELVPGRYCDRLRIEGKAKVTLRSTGGSNDGVYILEQGISIDGHEEGWVESDGGILLFATCPNGPCDGRTANDVRAAGQADIDIKGHPGYENIVIWVDRTAGPGVSVDLSGQAVEGFDGNVYAYSTTVKISGQSEPELTLNMAIVGDQIDISGQGTLNIPYNIDLAPTMRFIRLVE